MLGTSKLEVGKMADELFAALYRNNPPIGEDGAFTIEFCCSEHLIVNFRGEIGHVFCRIGISVLPKTGEGLDVIFGVLKERYAQQAKERETETRSQQSRDESSLN